jgi:lipoprotein-releasing system permease protein
MVGAIIMMISDKKRNLKTFYKMGASIHQIKNVFLMQGVLLTFFSLIIGLSIAILLVLFQQEFQLFMITPYIAYPVKLTFFNFLTVFSTIIVLGFLASWIASSRVNRNLLTN